MAAVDGIIQKGAVEAKILQERICSLQKEMYGNFLESHSGSIHQGSYSPIIGQIQVVAQIQQSRHSLYVPNRQMQRGLPQKVDQEKAFFLTGKLLVWTWKSILGQYECLDVGDSGKSWLMIHEQGKVIEEERIGSEQFAFPIGIAWFWPPIGGWRIESNGCEAVIQDGGEQMQVPALANPV